MEAEGNRYGMGKQKRGKVNGKGESRYRKRVNGRGEVENRTGRGRENATFFMERIGGKGQKRRRGWGD